MFLWLLWLLVGIEAQVEAPLLAIVVAELALLSEPAAASQKMAAVGWEERSRAERGAKLHAKLKEESTTYAFSVAAVRVAVG